MNCTRFKRLKRVVFPAFILFSLFASVCSYAQNEEIPLYLESGEDFLIYDDSTSSLIDSAYSTPTTAYDNMQVTPDEAYRQLVAGNARYLKEDSIEARNLPKPTFQGTQYPIATILYSLDMPVLPTTLTQTTDRDVYLTGVKAGAVSSDDFAAIEYGLLNLQTPLLVIIGHYPSRDVSSLIRQYDALEKRAEAEAAKFADSGLMALPEGTTTDDMKLYNLVGPAVARTKEAYPDLQGYELSNIVTEALVWQSLETILMKSTVAQDLVRVGKLNVIAAIADDNTGKIYWLGEHPLQDEFLAPAPEELLNTDQNEVILTDAELPPPLAEIQIQEYVEQYEANTYYNDVIDYYYIQPEYYIPSWELFSSRAWCYRPWYGVWVEPFTPWPYWQPWGYPSETDTLGLDVSIWNGRLSFYIGYNRYHGPYRSWDPHFRPHSSWWSLEVFTDPVGHWQDPVFDLLWRGLHDDISHVPFDQRPWRKPAKPRSRSSGYPRQGTIQSPHRSTIPGGPIGAPPKTQTGARRYQPGDARPGFAPRIGNWGIGSRFGGGSGIGGSIFRPGNAPGLRRPGIENPGNREPGPDGNDPRQPGMNRGNSAPNVERPDGLGVVPGSGPRQNPSRRPGNAPETRETNTPPRPDGNERPEAAPDAKEPGRNPAHPNRAEQPGTLLGTRPDANPRPIRRPGNAPETKETNTPGGNERPEAAPDAKEPGRNPAPPNRAEQPGTLLRTRPDANPRPIRRPGNAPETRETNTPSGNERPEAAPDAKEPERNPASPNRAEQPGTLLRTRPDANPRPIRRPGNTPETRETNTPSGNERPEAALDAKEPGRNPAPPNRMRQPGRNPASPNRTGQPGTLPEANNPNITPESGKPGNPPSLISIPQTSPGGRLVQSSRIDSLQRQDNISGFAAARPSVIPSTNQQRPVGTEGAARPAGARLTSFDNLVENRRASVPDISIRDFRSNASERANANYTPPRNASANRPANTDLRNELSSQAARLESNFRNNIPQRPLSSGNTPSARSAGPPARNAGSPSDHVGRGPNFVRPENIGSSARSNRPAGPTPRNLPSNNLESAGSPTGPYRMSRP